jgi:hypothetical protein
MIPIIKISPLSLHPLPPRAIHPSHSPQHQQSHTKLQAISSKRLCLGEKTYEYTRTFQSISKRRSIAVRFPSIHMISGREILPDTYGVWYHIHLPVTAATPAVTLLLSPSASGSNPCFTSHWRISARTISIVSACTLLATSPLRSCPVAMNSTGMAGTFWKLCAGAGRLDTRAI